MAEFDELLITTGVDALVRLVKEKGRIEIDSVASLLNIPQATIEEWAHILEEEGIIALEYKLTKTYIVWSAPSAEEISAKKSGIYTEKKNVAEEINLIRSRVQPDLNSFEELKNSFSKFYEKSYPKIEQLEKALGGLARPGEAAPVVKEDAKKIQAKISSLSSDLEKMNGELNRLKQQLSKPLPEIKIKGATDISSNISLFSKRLSELESKANKISSAIPEDMPKLDSKKALDAMKKEFEGIKKACAIVRDDILSIKEASQLMDGMGDEIKTYEKDIAILKKQLDALNDSAEKFNLAGTDLMKKLKSQYEVLGHFSESVDVAKGVFARFPTQEKLEAQLKGISAREEALQNRMEALDKLSSMPRGLYSEFEDLQNKIEKEKEFLEGEGETLSRAISGQSSVYSTFQKIRERAIVSMQAYYAQLRDLSQEVEKLKAQADAATHTSEQSALAYKSKIKEKDYAELMKAAAEIVSKKQALDRISETFDSISATADNLNRALDILSKKAKLLEVRQGIPSQAAEQRIAQEKQEIAAQVKLTREEEEEFRRKREELRDLIKRLWEEQS